MKFEKYEKQIEKDWVNFFYDSKQEDDSILDYGQNGEIINDIDRERNHLIIALAKNRNTWKWIDKIYSLRKHEYYISYKNSFFSNTPLKEVFSLHTKEYINKLAGIAYWCKENNTEEPLLKIIQKEHNKIYSRFKVGIKEIDVDKVVAERLDKVKKQTKDDSELLLEKNTQLDELITVILFLCKVYDVETEGFLWRNLYTGYISNAFTGITGYLSAKKIIDSHQKSELINLTEKIFETKYKKIKKCKNLYELYNLLLVEQNHLSRKTSVIMNATPDIADSLNGIKEKIIDMVMLEGNAFTSAEDILEKILDDSATKYAESIPTRDFGLITSFFSVLPRVTGLEKEIFLDMPVNIDMIWKSIVYTLEKDYDKYVDEKKQITINTRLQVLASTTILSMLEYHKDLELKTLDSEDEMVVEIENLKNELKNKDEEIAKLKEKIEEINKNKKAQMNEVLNELDLSKKNIKRLKKEVEDAKKDHVEYLALKEYAYKKNLSESEIALTLNDEVSIDEKIKYLNDRQIAIFGGHPNWVNKLKKLLPDAKYIDTNAFSSRKFNRLDKYDLLVVCNLYISHGLFYKVGEAIKNVKSKKVIIIDDINTDLIINNLYNTIKEYETTC